MNKLTGTITAKENIKGKLNNKEVQVYPSAEEQIKADITDIKSKNTEQDKKIAELENENIKLRNQIPSGTTNGNAIHIEDSSDLELKWKLKGEHKQETREGYNLLDFNVAQDGRVTANNDGTITINGKGGFSIKIKELEFKKGATYKTKATLVSGTYTSSDPNHIGIMTPYENNKWLANDIFNTYTFLEDKVCQGMWVGVKCVFNNATFKIYSYEGTEEKPFEQYGASPSLDYPSEIETVGSNINLFDKDNVNKINAYFDSTIHSNSANRVFWLKIDKNQDYTISKVKGKVFGIAFTDQLPKAGVSIYGTKYNNTGEVITINSGSYDYLVCYYWSTSDVLTEQQIIDSIKIEKGTVATPYSLYNQGSVRIDVVNKNLFDKNNANKLSGYIDNSGYLHYDTNNKIIYVKCKANTDYVISSKSIKGVAFFNKVPKTGLTSTNFKILTTSELTLNSKENTYLAYWYYSSTLSLTEQEILNSIQIEQGLKATNFVEHQSQTVTMPVQQEMLEGDYIDDVEHHEWGKIILTGEEDWKANWQNNDQKNSKSFALPVSFFGNKIPNYAESALKNNLSSHFSEIFSTVWSKDVDSYAINISPEYSFQIRLTKETLKYNDNVTNNELKILFQSWLKSQYNAGTPVIVYYKLATPLDLELTTEQKAIREQKLHTYKNVTNIDVSDELASIDVNYKKDLTTEHDELQNQIDEIKQLISTTETSALLLDNLQKDVESEVE